MTRLLRLETMFFIDTPRKLFFRSVWFNAQISCKRFVRPIHFES